jgi:hypothetical protein
MSRPFAPLCKCGMLPVMQTYKKKRWITHELCASCIYEQEEANQTPPAPTLESLQEEINELRERIDSLTPIKEN